MSDLTFQREEAHDGSVYYDVMTPRKPEAVGNIYLLEPGHQNKRCTPGQWMYEQEDDCCSLSAQDLLCIANKVMELTLETQNG